MTEGDKPIERVSPTSVVSFLDKLYKESGAEAVGYRAEPGRPITDKFTDNPHPNGKLSVKFGADWTLEEIKDDSGIYLPLSFVPPKDPEIFKNILTKYFNILEKEQTSERDPWGGIKTKWRHETWILEKKEDINT